MSNTCLCHLDPEHLKKNQKHNFFKIKFFPRIQDFSTQMYVVELEITQAKSFVLSYNLPVQTKIFDLRSF